MKDGPTHFFFALLFFFQNEAVTDKLQPSPQYSVSFAYTFCQGLTFVSDFFPPLVRSLNNYSKLLSRGNRIFARPENSPCARKTTIAPRNNQCAQKTTSAPKKQPMLPENSHAPKKESVLPEDIPRARKTARAPEKKQSVRPENSQCAQKTTHAPGKQPMRPKISQCARKAAHAPGKQLVLPENSQCTQKTAHVPGKQPVRPEKSPCALTLNKLSLFLLDVLPSTVRYIPFNQHHRWCNML